MTDPSYVQGWLPEAEFRRLNLAPDVSYRAVMRLSDQTVWCAPLGTPDPWTPEDSGDWVDVTPDPR